MGMFDYVKVEIKIPGFDDIPKDIEFQTKSFENLMENYVITVKGELYREKWDYEHVEDSSHFLGGYFHRIENSYRREYLTDFHGDVIFYTGLNSDRIWRDYHARFTEGRLTRIWYKDTQY